MRIIGWIVLISSMFFFSFLLIVLFLVVGVLLFEYPSLNSFMNELKNDSVLTYVFVTTGMSFYFGSSLSLTVMFYLSERKEVLDKALVRSLFRGTDEEFEKLKRYFYFLR